MRGGDAPDDTLCAGEERRDPGGGDGLRIRELLIRQRTQAVNALRGHLTEFGQIAPQGAADAARPIAIIEDPESDLPPDAIATLEALVAALRHGSLSSAMRIGSISKAVCGDVMGSMIVDGTVGIADPLASHLDADWTVPERDGRILRLLDLVTQSSGLPREVPNQGDGPPDDPFAGNTYELLKAELGKDDPYLFPPGTGVRYSNWGFDLLGLALGNAAGKPYAELLAERVLVPRGMTDTKSNLDEGDEARTMQGHFFDGSPMPLARSPEAILCSGGLYSTARDMQKWMAWHLGGDPADDAWRTVDHAGWLWRDGMTPVGGIDDAGLMGAMTLGWVGVMPEGRQPMKLHKTGGLQGQFSYVVIAPAHGVGVFASMNQFSVDGFTGMVKAANGLIAELAPR